MNIIAFNLNKRIAAIGDGTMCPITNMLNSDGEETTDTSEVVAIIVNHPQGWLVYDVSGFENVTIN